MMGSRQDGHDRKVNRSVPSALRWYLSVFLLLALVGWGTEILGRAGVRWVDGDYSALFHPSSQFGDVSAFTDLTDFAARMKYLSGNTLREGIAPFPYPPAAAFVFRFFLGFGDPAEAYLWGFGACFGVAVVAAMWACRRCTTARGPACAAVGATLLLGSPAIFCANRGNLEWVNWAPAVLAVCLWLRGRTWSAAVALALAMSVKPFPALFLLLFLWKRQWRQAALAVALCAGVSAAALWALGPDIATAARGVGDGWQAYALLYVRTVRVEQELRFNHSLMDMVKVPIWFVLDHRQYDPRELAAASGVPWWARLDWWARAAEAVAGCAVAWVWWRFGEMPTLNRIFALTLLLLLLPFASAEYTLMLLYLPWALLLLAMTSVPWEASRGTMLRLLLPCAALFSPLNFLSCFTGFAKTLLLLWLLWQVGTVKLPVLPEWLEAREK